MKRTIVRQCPGCPGPVFGCPGGVRTMSGHSSGLRAMVDEKQDSGFRPGIMAPTWTDSTDTPVLRALLAKNWRKFSLKKAEQITPSGGRIQQQRFRGEFRENLG